MEILALHPGALGDIILSLPALRLLREKFAGARLTLAGNLDHLAIVPASCADRKISLSSLPLQRLFGAPPVPREDVNFWMSFDRIVSWTGSEDPRFAANLGMIHPNALIASWKPCASDKRHVSRIFADTLIPWVSYSDQLNCVTISPDPGEVAPALTWLRNRGWSPETPMIALQPGAGSASKRWALRHFADTAERLLERRVGKILIIEGPAEPRLGSGLAETLPAQDTLVAASLPLGHLAAILSMCRAYVGNDSGISHLAAAVGIPCVVIFGPTSDVHWAPLGPNLAVLRNTSGCAACAGGSSGTHTCLENTSPGDVMRVLAAVLG